MSTIRKKPYVESVLESVLSTDTNKENFIKVLNGTDSAGNVFRTLVGSSNRITNDDKGVKAVNLELALGNIKSGILLYNNTYCVLIAYHRFQDVAIFNLDIAKQTFTKVNEECDINELRRVYDEHIEGGGDEWVEEMKSKIYVDDDDIVQHTDPSEFQEDIKADGKIKIVDLQKIVDTDGDPIIPDPTGHAGEFLKHTSTGYGWEAVSGGTKLYKHTLSNSTQTFIFISTNDNQFNYDPSSSGYKIKGAFINCYGINENEYMQPMFVFDEEEHSPGNFEVYACKYYFANQSYTNATFFPTDLVDVVTEL